MRIVFMGTPQFAASSLDLLLQKHEVAGVFTKPDKPVGRGMKLRYSPVKDIALSHGIPVFQPETLRNDNTYEDICALKPDLIAVVAYGLFLPQRYLELPKYGCINVHGSLLPKYRGAAPIQRAIMQGETETGVCTMHMVREMDAGDVILSKSTNISENDTFGTIHDRLMMLGAELLLETIPLLERGCAPRIPQDSSCVTFAPPITDTKIDWSRTAREIFNFIRGLSPYPGASSNGFKLHASRLDGECGGIKVNCGDGEPLWITELQAPGGKRMSAGDYMRGHGAPDFVKGD